MLDREALIKEYEGYSIEELDQKLEELLEYKKSPELQKEYQEKGQEVVTMVNQRIHTAKMILNFRRNERFKKEIAEMLKEYGEDDPEEVIQK